MTGDGYIWGNESTDWTAFEVEQDGGNFWYPGTAGCYYTVLNTVDLEWTATLISELNLVDADGNTIAMTYSRTSNQWSAVIDNSAAVEYSITGVTQYYDINTGDSDYTDGTCSFGATGGTLTWGGTEALSVSSTGEQTIILALSDPTNLYYEIASGAVEEEEEVENLLEYDEATGVACKTVTTTLSGSDFVEILTADEVSTILGYTYDNVKVTISGITSSTTNWISVYSDTSWSNETGFGFWGNESTTCIYDITDNLSKYESTGMYMAGVVGDDEVTITISYLVTVSEGSYDASSAVQILTADQVSSLLGYDSITIKISGIESSEETWMSLISDTSWNNEISAGLWGYTNTEFAFTIDSATLANYTSDGIYLSGSSSCSAVTVYVTYNATL